MHCGDRKNVTLRQPANEVGGVVGTSGSCVLRNSWVRTERSGAVHASVGDMSCDDAVRRLAPFNPVVECPNRVEHVWSFTPCAVVHAGNHEQPHPRIGRGCAADCIHDSSEVVDARARGNRAIRPTMIDEEFAAATGEFVQIGRRHVGDSAIHFLRLRKVTITSKVRQSHFGFPHATNAKRSTDRGIGSFLPNARGSARSNSAPGS